MNNLYVRLAAQNIKKHRRSYVPFMLAGVFCGSGQLHFKFAFQ